MKGSATIVLHTREILGRYTGISTGLYTLYIILQYVWVFSLKVYGLVRKITDFLKLRNQQKIQVFYLIFLKDIGKLYVSFDIVHILHTVL